MGKGPWVNGGGTPGPEKGRVPSGIYLEVLVVQKWLPEA